MSIFAAGVSVVLNGILIPVTEKHLGNGGIGAAAATAATECFVLIFCFRLLPAGFFDRECWLTLLRCAVSAGAMSAAVLAAHALPLPVVIAIGAVAYIACIFAVGGVRREDVGFVLGMARRKKRAPAPAVPAAPAPATGTAILAE